MTTLSSAKTLGEALATASRYWEANDRSHSRRSSGGCKMMPIRAGRCVDILGGPKRALSSLTPSDGTKLLTELGRELSRSSVASYYAAGRRMIALAGGPSTALWPKPPKVPRVVREPVSDASVMRLLGDLKARGWEDTAELVEVLRHTGMRVEVEALSGPLGVSQGMLHVEAGKGGHSRLIPGEVTAHTGELPEDRYGGLTYEGHLRRIRVACDSLGVSLKPHDLRRAYAKRVYEDNGKDLRTAQVLLGHADPGTTAGYIGVDYAAIR